MTRRRWRIQRVMVVPAQWQGSVEHFYHFALGYFVPLVRWQESTGSMAFDVRDCGPMNGWFELLRDGSDIGFMPPGVMLERYLSHRQERQVLRDWDNPTKFHGATLRAVRDAVVPRSLISAAPPSSRPRITVLDRRPSPSFYLESGSEVHGSGADWRSVPNMEAVASTLDSIGDVALVDAASLAPREQVALMAATDVLVAQHGAGLANMTWLPPGSAVLEIQPPLPPIIDMIFANLAAALGHDHVLLRQEHEHAAVEPAGVRGAVERLVADPGRHVPQPPGRFPTRILRRLPRRL